MRSSIVKGLTFKCVIWPYPLEMNAKHCTYVHNQTSALRAPQDCWGQGLSQRGHARLVCHGFRTTPRKSPVHMLPNQMHMERTGTKTEKSTQLEKNLQVWERHTYTQQEHTDGTNSNIHVQTCTVRRLKPGDSHCLGLIVVTEPLALHCFMTPKGQEKWFPTHRPRLRSAY